MTPMRFWFPPACPSLSPQSAAWLGDATAWSFHLRSCLFRAQIAVLILAVCLAVTPSFGYASAVWGDSRSSKISRVWQNSHSVLLSSLWSRACSGTSCTRTEKWMLSVLPSLLCLFSPVAEMPQLSSSSRNHKQTGAQVLPCQVSDSWMFKAYACTLGWK